MENYCPYCAKNISASRFARGRKKYLCGSPVNASIDDRSRECLVGEIEILRADKQHLTTQNYDLSWQLRHYAAVASAVRESTAEQGAEIVAALAGLEALSTPFPQRDDDLTRGHRERMETLAGRYTDI